MPFSRPSLSEIITRVQDDIDARLPGVDSRLRHNVIGVFARVIGAGFSLLYGLVDWLWRQAFVDSAEAEQLARHAVNYRVTRKGAQAASGIVALTGVDGSIVPIGSVMIRSDGAEFATTAAGTIAAGVASVAVAAVEAGVAGNGDAGQRLTFVSPIGGVNATGIVAAGGLVEGVDEEDDEALRARVIDRIRKPPHGGNADDYIMWALELSGVTRAWVYPNEQGPGTVVVRFVRDGDANLIPDGAEIAALQSYIGQRRPVCAALTVLAPTPIPLAMTIRATPNSAAVQAAIAAAIDDLLRREAAPGGIILISHLREAVSLAAGEADHAIINPINDVVRGVGEISVTGPITWM